MTNLPRLLGRCFPLMMLAGCGAVAPPSQEVTEATVAGNGHLQNGHLQNGHLQNGHLQNGREMAISGVDLSTMQRLINGAPDGTDPDLSPSNLEPVTGVKLVGSMLTNDYISGTEFSGHVVAGTLTDGTTDHPATFYISKIEVSAADPEIYHYELRAYYQFIPADLQGPCDGDVCPMVWDYACGSTNTRIHNPDGTITFFDKPTQATALGGQWDYHEGVVGNGSKVIEQGNPDYDTKITFACTTGAIGKCVEKLNYKPWDTAQECRVQCLGGGRLGLPVCKRTCTTTGTRELMHEACVRMIRADYCGDGVSHTVDGISIDVWDNASINTMTSISETANPGYGHEGEWTPNGARCLSNALMGRVASDVDHQPLVDYLHEHCRDKWNGQPNQQGKPFVWELNDCFNQGTSSRATTYALGNVPEGFDWHDRVFIENTSMCVVDRERANPYKSVPPCLDEF